MRADLKVIGPQATLPRRVAASATRFEFGEPLIQAGATFSTGTATANVFTLAATDIGVIGSDNFGGIALEGAEPKNSSSTLVAQTVNCACPVSWLGQIEGQAEDSTLMDTASELLDIIQDTALIDYNSSGGTDGGELYTIKETTSVDTGAFQIVEGNIGKGTLRVIMDGRFYRLANDITG